MVSSSIKKDGNIGNIRASIGAEIFNVIDKFTTNATEYTEMYHYSNSAAFKDIVNESGLHLWASDIRCLNDSSECQDGIKIYKKVCEQLRNDVRISPNSTFIDDIYNLMPSDGLCIYKESTSEELRITGDKMEMRYVCCFSIDPDNLPMWNYYSKNSRYEGFNVGLLTEAIDDLNTFWGTGIHASLFKVVYDNTEKQQIITNAIMSLYSLSLEYKEHITIIFEAIQTLLRYWTLVFKNSKFVHEKEIRLVIEAPRQVKDHDVYKEPPLLQIRSDKGLIIPYYTLPLKKRSLRSITLGPLLISDNDKKNQELIISDYLARCKYTKGQVKIFTSDIPVRY